MDAGLKVNLPGWQKREMAESNCERFQITPEKVNLVVEEMIKRFIDDRAV